jgi:hypothetical protein
MIVQGRFIIRELCLVFRSVYTSTYHTLGRVKAERLNRSKAGRGCPQPGANGRSWNDCPMSRPSGIDSRFSHLKEPIVSLFCTRALRGHCRANV